MCYPKDDVMFSKYPQVEDFIENLSFRKAVFGQDDAAVQYWAKWAAENPQHRENAEEAKQILLSIQGSLPAITQQQVDASVHVLLQRIDRKKQNALPRHIGTWRAAAAAVFLLGIGAAVWQLKTSETGHSGRQAILFKEDIWETVINDGRGHQLVLLPDGSSAVLKQHSILRFPKKFETHVREVTLTGESFFEVAKDSQWPFIVQANGLITHVVGTSFTVQAYPGDAEVKVSVKTGKVMLYQQRDSLKGSTQPECVLVPNQQAVFQRAQKKIVGSELQKAEVQAVPIFTEYFEFKRTPIAQVFKTLEQAYGVTISFDEELAATCTLTASLGDVPLLEKLTAITLSVGATFQIQGNSIEILLQQKCL